MTCSWVFIVFDYQVSFLRDLNFDLHVDWGVYRDY